MTDINPNVRKVVELLQGRGFTTCDSGDGQTHDHACDRDHAYVSVAVAPSMLVPECVRIMEVLRGAGVDVTAIAMEDTPAIQGTYDPASGYAIIDVTHVTDDMLGF